MRTKLMLFGVLAVLVGMSIFSCGKASSPILFDELVKDMKIDVSHAKDIVLSESRGFIKVMMDSSSAYYFSGKPDKESRYYLVCGKNGYWFRDEIPCRPIIERVYRQISFPVTDGFRNYDFGEVRITQDSENNHQILVIQAPDEKPVKIQVPDGCPIGYTRIFN
jgi:hypothetical protein